MSIKSQGGVFGRNPTFNDVAVEGDLSIAGTLTIGGETITGLSYQGGWNASTNTPDIAASSPVTGQFWIVSVDGSTNVGGITNWTSGDWALYDGSAWQRVEGGNTDLTTGVQGQLAVANGGTGAADASTARTNLGLGTAATTASTDYATAAQGSLADSALQSSDIGVSVQGYDATILTSSDIGSTVQGYDANILTSSDIGSSVQGYDADTAKLDVVQTFTANQRFPKIGIGTAAAAYAITTSASDALCGIACYNTNGAQPVVFRQNDDGTCQISNFDNAPMTFVTNAQERLRINAAGGLDVSAGNIAVDSGYGIDFSATSGTGTSELFDDYEEGTWTPVVNSGNTMSYTTQTGRYTKIGNLVYCTFYVVGSASTSTGSGIANVGGLPYALRNPGSANGQTGPLASTTKLIINSVWKENVFASPYASTNATASLYYTTGGSGVYGADFNGNSFTVSGTIIAHV